jgi:hypothetical protein
MVCHSSFWPLTSMLSLRPSTSLPKTGDSGSIVRVNLPCTSSSLPTCFPWASTPVTAVRSAVSSTWNAAIPRLALPEVAGAGARAQPAPSSVRPIHESR